MGLFTFDDPMLYCRYFSRNELWELFTLDDLSLLYFRYSSKYELRELFNLDDHSLLYFRYFSKYELHELFTLVDLSLLYFRYFSKYELRELFTLDDPHSSTTQQQLEQMHSGHRLTDPSLDEHLAFLYSLGRLLT